MRLHIIPLIALPYFAVLLLHLPTIHAQSTASQTVHSILSRGWAFALAPGGPDACSALASSSDAGTAWAYDAPPSLVAGPSVAVDGSRFALNARRCGGARGGVPVDFTSLAARGASENPADASLFDGVMGALRDRSGGGGGGLQWAVEGTVRAGGERTVVCLYHGSGSSGGDDGDAKDSDQVRVVTWRRLVFVTLNSDMFYDRFTFRGNETYAMVEFSGGNGVAIPERTPCLFAAKGGSGVGEDGIADGEAATTLSTVAIVGIIAGGVVLLLLLSCACLICVKAKGKGSSRGVDNLSIDSFPDRAVSQPRVHERDAGQTTGEEFVGDPRYSSSDDGEPTLDVTDRLDLL